MKLNRIVFLKGQQRNFIELAHRKSGYSIDRLAEIAHVHPRSFRDWKREKLTMTLTAAERFCELFNILLPEDKNIMLARWEAKRREICRKGGFSCFRKYGNPATLDGCRKGGLKAIANLHKNGIVPIQKIYVFPKGYHENLAEFVGIMLGDGGITSGQCMITLNREADAEYVQFVLVFLEKLFGEKPKFFIRKDSKAIVIYYNGFLLIDYLVNLGLKVGNKVKQQVDVPEWVKENKNFKIACLRGLMDTDGGVFIHKYTVNGKEYFYKKICFSNRSIPLLKFVAKTLKELGFTPKIIDKVVNKKVWLYNSNEVNQYLVEVGTHNSRLLKYQ